MSAAIESYRSSYEQKIESETESNKEDDLGDISDDRNNLIEETVRNIVSIKI